MMGIWFDLPCTAKQNPQDKAANDVNEGAYLLYGTEIHKCSQRSLAGNCFGLHP